MDYKALEDLISILVKKSGTDIYAGVAKFQKSKLENEYSDLETKEMSLKSEMSEEKYNDIEALKKDERKLSKKVEEIGELESKISHYKEELECINFEFESLVEEKKELNKELLFLQKELRISQIDKEEGALLNDEISKTTNFLSEIMDKLIRKEFLEEEIVVLESEVSSLKKLKEDISNKVISNKYYNGLNKAWDDESLKEIEKQKSLINDYLNKWKENPELCAKEILDSYKNDKSYEDVAKKVDFLVYLAKEELRYTHEEIEGSNIFREMDKYVRLTEDLNKIISSKNYENNYKLGLNESINQYRNLRIKSLIEKKEALVNNIDEIKSNIDKLTKMYEIIKKNRILVSEKLNEKQERLLNANLKSIPEEAVKDIENIIVDIQSEIENYKTEELKCLTDVDNYKEELSKMECELIRVDLEIERESKSEQKHNNVDLMDLLNDKILLIEHKNRLDSIVIQKQYLYVDPDVIKEEIEILWNRKTKITPKSNKKREVIEATKPEEVLEIFEI